MLSGILKKSPSHPLPDIVRRSAAAALFNLSCLTKGAQVPLHRRSAHGWAELGDLRLGEFADPRPNGVANGIDGGGGDYSHTLLEVPVRRNDCAQQIFDKGHRVVLPVVPSALRRLQSVIVVFLRLGNL